MQFLLGIIYIIVVGAVLWSMALLRLRGERSAAGNVYFFCESMVVLWCASQILRMVATDKWELWAAFGIGNLGICFVGCAWLYFAMLYTGRELRGLRRYLPAILSVCFYLSVLSNGWHHLYYRVLTLDSVEHGPIFYANVVMTYLFTIAGSELLYQNTKKEDALARRLVVASVLIPVGLNVLYLTGVVKTSFDITPLGFGISIVLILRATWTYRFMNLQRELVIVNEKLLLEQERNRIAQQVHDTSGHTLTMIQSYMKLAEVSVDNGKYDEVKTYLSEARTLTGQGIRELRESINMLREGAQYELVTQGVMHLANQVKEISVEVTVRGEDNSRYSHLSQVVYDTVRESITNTLKYADASKMDIVLRFQPHLLDVMLADDGKGCADITANNGLRGIRERIEAVGGSVHFQSNDGEGFLTRFKLPVE